MAWKEVESVKQPDQVSSEPVVLIKIKMFKKEKLNSVIVHLG